MKIKTIKKTKKIIFISLFAFILLPIFSQSEKNEEFESLFKSGIYKKNGVELPFRTAHFNGNDKSEPVLVVFMHGHSAFGKDNSNQLTKETLKNIVRYVQKNSLNAFVLAPQCDESSKWTEIPDVLNSFYSEFKEEHGCSKILLSGDSMGGCGVWLLIDKFPFLAEKAVVLGAAPFKPNIKNFTKTKIFAVCGENDDFGSIKRIEPVIKKINEMNGSAYIKILKNLDHIQTCMNGMSEDVLEFFFGRE